MKELIKMKIDYNNALGLADQLSGVFKKDIDFVKQVIKDGGQVFFGVVSPVGVRIQIGLNNKEFDKMMEDQDDG